MIPLTVCAPEQRRRPAPSRGTPSRSARLSDDATAAEQDEQDGSASIEGSVMVENPAMEHSASQPVGEESS
jgi:hypothetical protein